MLHHGARRRAENKIKKGWGTRGLDTNAPRYTQVPRANSDDCTDRLDAAMWPSLTQTGSPPSELERRIADMEATLVPANSSHSVVATAGRKEEAPSDGGHWAGLLGFLWGNLSDGRGISTITVIRIACTAAALG